MTLPTLRSAKQIALLVTGEEKAEVVKRALQGDITVDIPASLLRLAPSPVLVFLDRAAASELTG